MIKPRIALRTSFALALALGSGAAVAASAAPAQARSLVGPCPGTWYENVVDPGVSITAYHYYECPGPIPEPISLDVLVGADWVAVATGTGSVTYTCSGSAENEYSVLQSGTTFEAACG